MLEEENNVSIRWTALRWSKLCKPRTAQSLGQVSCFQNGNWGVVSTTLVNDSVYFTHDQTFTFTQSASPSHLGPGPRHGSPPTACSARQDLRNPRWCSNIRWPGLENQEALLSCAHLWREEYQCFVMKENPELSLKRKRHKREQYV